MNATCRQEEDIAFLDIVTSNDISDGVICHHFFVFFGSNRFGQSRKQVSIFIGFDDIPHFGFTLRTIVAYTSQGVIGMHLDAQIGSCINKLDEQGELIASVVIDMTTHNLFFILFQEFYDGLSSQTAFCHYRFIARNA